MGGELIRCGGTSGPLETVLLSFRSEPRHDPHLSAACGGGEFGGGGLNAAHNVLVYAPTISQLAKADLLDPALPPERLASRQFYQPGMGSPKELMPPTCENSR